MKKKSKMIIELGLVLTISVLLTGCGNKAKETSTTSEVKNEEKTSGLEVTYEKVNVTPGEKFDESKIDKEATKSTVTSCAFEGEDNVYTYDNAEITVANIDGTDTVYSVYFLDDSISTKEGVKIGDTKDDMINKYGKDYEESPNQYTYTKGKVKLSFVLNNDKITGIEYTLVTE